MRCNQSKKSRGYGAYRRTRARWARLAPVVTLAFVWSGVFAPAAKAWANQPPSAPGHTRPLSLAEMRAIVGAQFAQVGCVPTAAPVDSTTGAAYPWEGQTGGVNTFDGNKLTSVPIVGWTARGGLPVQFTLYHNSQATTGTMPLSAKWSHSYNIFLTVDGSTGNATIHWGDARCYTFTANLGGSFSPPTGIHDMLVANGSPVTSYDLTTPDQTKYHLAYYNSMTGGWYVSSISDPNGNIVTCNYNTNRELTTIVDPTGRTLTLGYNTGCEIASVTDPLSRQWTISYNGSGDLSKVTWPVVNGSSFNEQFGYDAAGHHDITSWTDRRGHSSTFTYNTNDSLATETDACSNETTFTYNTNQTVITDPNGHTTTHDYDASGRLSDVVDAAGHTESYGYDSANNRTSVTDKRGKLWQFTYDTAGNVLTKTDPNSNEWVWTYNSKNRELTATDPMSHEVVNTYDSNLNWLLTETDEKDSSGTVLATTTFGYDAGGHGLLVSKTDANSHTTSYGHNTNGDLTSVITPNSRETDFGVDGLGVRTSREDALRRTTTYTLDNWERVSTTTNPDSSTHTFSYDANSNLTGWTDGQGTWARAYDNDNRITSESLNGTTRFSYSYDGAGQKGLLSSMTDPNSRTISYSYTSRNEVSSVGEAAGSATYSFDANGNLTSVTNPNGTTVTNVYDDADRLTSVTNATSGGTTLSSFSYGYNADGQRTSVTEADGSVVSFGYDGQHHLTSETRTGTNPYSKSYVVDGVGNRTSETVGGTTTTFTLDTDDELTATSGGCHQA